MNDDELAEIVKRYPEFGGLARLIEDLPSANRAEAITGFIEFIRFYEGRTLEQRAAILEYMADYADELAAKAQD